MNDFLQYKEDSDYLQHFGILGMKWGIRRYQNKDGSLTAEGKQRYQEKIRDYYRKEDNYNKNISGNPNLSSKDKMRELSKTLKESRKLSNEIDKITGYKKEITDVNQKISKEVIDYVWKHIEDATNFNKIVNSDPNILDFLQGAAKGSYEDFLQNVDYNGMSEKFKDTSELRGIYEYSKAMNDIQARCDQQTDAIFSKTVDKLGYDSNSEEAKKVKGFLKNLS